MDEGIPSLNQVGPHGRAWSMPSESIMVHNHNHLIHGNYLGQHFHPMPYIQAPYINGSSLESASMGFQHDIVGNRNGLMLLHPPPFIQQHQHYQYHHPTLAMQRVLPNPPCSIAIPLQIAFQIYQADRFMPAIIRHHVLYSLGFVLVYDYILLGQVQNPVDHHQDMRLNIEGMSYEELLALGERIGNASTALLEETIKTKVKTKLYSPCPTTMNLEEVASHDQEIDVCIICQEEFKNKEKIGILRCGHEYHLDCITKWLVVKNVCPLCKSEALPLPKKE
uniref:RING-type E3 ubiquitin transferase n=1 Tax=Cicer arietinum TaxID=3827 RepID=A0A1S2XGN6_CICAR|nr:RING finger protein 44-like [Cicer arietinum]